MTFHDAVLTLAAAGFYVPLAVDANTLATALRMPLFFTASGLFAGSVLRSGWPEMWNKRLFLYVWLFTLWTILSWLFFAVVTSPYNPARGTDLAQILSALYHPTSELWFIWVLAVYFIVAKPLIAGGPRLALGIALCLAIFGHCLVELETHNYVLNAISKSIAYLNALKYFFFFIGAALYRDVVLGWVSGRARLIAIVAPAYVAFAVVAHFTDGTILGGIVTLAASIAGVLTTMNLARALFDRFEAAQTVLSHLGRRTLPIYLIQAPLLTLIAYSFLGIKVESLGMLSNLLPLMAVFLFIPISLQLESGASQIGWSWLYSTPKRTAQLRQKTA